MKCKFLILILTVAILGTVLPIHAGEVLDRIVATVNGHIILQSDWGDALRYEAFIGGRALSQFTLQDRKAALDHLIDQELLREQIIASDFQHATEREVAARIQEIRKQYAGTETDRGWHDALTRCGLAEDELKARIALQLDLMRLVDTRLRPSVSIDSKSIESYYNQELLPQLRQSGEKAVSLAEVSTRIKELLTQQKVDQLLTAWLQNLRSGSEIRTEPTVPDSGGQAR
jgi:peptidyl-prolyl cis-trans isomerase SurA